MRISTVSRAFFSLVSLTAGLALFLASGSTAAASATPRLERGPLVSDMLDRLNAARSAAGVAPLAEYEDASGVAVARALDMAANGYFAHINSAGIGPVELLAEQGVAYRAFGENIAKADYPVNSIAGVVHESLLNSPGHRANMLNPDYGRVGIGIAAMGNTYYFAFVFLD